MKPDFFSRYEAALLPAAQDAIEAKHAKPATRRRGLRATPLVAALVLLVGGGAIAATGVLPIGREVPAEQHGGRHEPARLGGRIVVATGRTPVHGRWQIFWSRSSVGDCLALQLLDDPSAPGLGEGCGRRTPISASALLPIPGAKAPVETLVYGRVPGATRKVRVVLPGLKARVVPATRGPGAVAGNWYLVGFPGRPSRGTGTVEALAADDGVIGRPLNVPVTLHPRYEAPHARYTGGDAIAVTRGYARVPLSCTRQPRREGRCVGTLSIRVRGLGLDSCRITGRRVRCGWRFFSLSPGTVDRGLRVRLGDDVLGLLRSRGKVPARLRYGGRSIDVVLVNEG